MALAAVVVWLFSGVIFLFVLLLLLAKLAVVFTMMWSLPVLLPLAAFDVGPIRYLSKPARGLIDMFIPFVFLTLPMALVLKVGYLTVNGLNQTTTAQLGMHFSGMNSLIILGFWLVAAISPLFVFSQMGQIRGIAAGLAGASAMSNLKEKVSDAKENVDWHVPPRYDKATGTHDPYEGAPSGGGGFGGPLGGSSGGTNRASMLNADRQRTSGNASTTSSALGGASTDSSLGAATAGSSLGAAANGSTLGAASNGRGLGTPDNGSPLDGDGTATAGAASSSSSAGAGTTASAGGTANRMVSTEDVTQVGHPRELPTETKYQVGQVKDSGEYVPVESNMQWTRSRLLTGGYSKLNNVRAYSDDKLLLRSRDDGTFYDIDSMSYREQSYEQMSRETSEDVLNS